MVYWLEHRFADHLSELELDGFVSPITHDLCRLTWQQREIARSILLKYPVSETDPDIFGARFGYTMSRTTLSKWTGKEVNPEAYKKALNALEAAGVFTFEREQARAHIFRPGEALRICEKIQCRITEHYPGLKQPPWINSSDILSTPSENLSLVVRKSEHTPQKSLDIKNLNNNQEITNTLSEISITENLPPGQSSEPNSEPGATASAALESLPDPGQLINPGFALWAESERKRKGLDTPSPMDIATAKLYTAKGLDLPEEGVWLTGGRFTEKSLIQVATPDTSTEEPATDQGQHSDKQQSTRTALAE